MASVTACGEIAPMRVVFGVTGFAGGIHISEYLGGVTVFAFIFVVSAEQRKLRQIVIEENRILPIDLGMAVLALSTQ